MNSKPFLDQDRPKYLGMTYDEKLTWKTHMNKVKQECNKRMNLLKCLRHTDWGSDSTTMLQLYSIEASFDPSWNTDVLFIPPPRVMSWSCWTLSTTQPFVCALALLDRLPSLASLQNQARYLYPIEDINSCSSSLPALNSCLHPSRLPTYSHNCP